MENFQDETYPTTSIQLAIYRQANFFMLVAKLTQLCYFMMLLNWEVWQSLQVMIVPQRSPSPEEVDGTTRHDRKGEMFSLIAELVSSELCKSWESCAIDAHGDCVECFIQYQFVCFVCSCTFL